MTANLRTSPFLHKFSGWFPSTSAEIEEALRYGIVAVDTNVLLDLYKYENSATVEWLSALEKLGSRLFIPRQVADEFWRNRDQHVASPIEARNAKTKISKSREQIEQEFKKWVARRGDRLTEEQSKQLSAVSDSINILLEQLESAENAHAERFALKPEDLSLIHI